MWLPMFRRKTLLPSVCSVICWYSSWGGKSLSSTLKMVAASSSTATATLCHQSQVHNTKSTRVSSSINIEVTAALLDLANNAEV